MSPTGQALLADAVIALLAVIGMIGLAVLIGITDDDEEEL